MSVLTQNTIKVTNIENTQYIKLNQTDLEFYIKKINKYDFYYILEVTPTIPDFILFSNKPNIYNIEWIKKPQFRVIYLGILLDSIRNKQIHQEWEFLDEFVNNLSKVNSYSQKYYINSLFDLIINNQDRNDCKKILKIILKDYFKLKVFSSFY